MLSSEMRKMLRTVQIEKFKENKKNHHLSNEKEKVDEALKIGDIQPSVTSTTDDRKRSPLGLPFASFRSK